MAEVKFTKGSEEWQMFMDYWGLCQKYWKPEPADEYWEALVVEMDVFYKKYGNFYYIITFFCVKIKLIYKEGGKDEQKIFNNFTFNIMLKHDSGMFCFLRCGNKRKRAEVYAFKRRRNSRVD